MIEWILAGTFSLRLWSVVFHSSLRLFHVVQRRSFGRSLAREIMTRSRSTPLLPQERRAQISRSTKNRLEIERWQVRSAPYPRRVDVSVEDVSEAVATGLLSDISVHSSAEKSKDKRVTTRPKRTAIIGLGPAGIGRWVWWRSSLVNYFSEINQRDWPISLQRVFFLSDRETPVRGDEWTQRIVSVWSLLWKERTEHLIGCMVGSV